MEAASTCRRSLGEYFVEQGLITRADLDRAHAEHLTTKRRLADILVKRGLVSGADITRALMDQLGMTEPSPAAPATVPPTAAQEPSATVPEAEPETSTPRPQPELVLVPPAEEPWPGEVDHTPWPGENAATERPEPWPGEIDFDAWPSEVALNESVPAGDAALPIDSNEPEPLVGAESEARHADPWDLAPDSSEPAVDPATTGSASLEAVPESVVETPVEPGPVAEAAPSDAFDEVHATIEAKRQELSEALATAASWTMRASELQVEIAELIEQADAAVAAPAPAGPEAATEPGAPAPPAGERKGAVFLVPGPDRFELVELDVEAPVAGATVHLGDGRYVVTSVTSSPLPFDRRSCAVLAETVETAS